MKHIPSSVLAELKQRLLEQKEKLLSLKEKVEEDSPANDEDRISDNASSDADAQEEMSLIQTEVVGDHLEDSVARIDAALQRMEDGTYGLDVETGEPIPVERLKIEPAAEHTVKNE